jgi:hypothetical protein
VPEVKQNAWAAIGLGIALLLLQVSSYNNNLSACASNNVVMGALLSQLSSAIENLGILQTCQSHLALASAVRNGKLATCWPEVLDSALPGRRTIRVAKTPP